MLEKRLSTEITARGIRNLEANTNLTFFGQGSIVRTMIETMAAEIEGLYDSIDLNLTQTRLNTASGVFLDLIGSQFGLTRLPGSTGSVLSEDKAVRFYVRSGRLVDYLPGSSTTRGVIPAGTLIYSSSGAVTYEVTTATTFPANASSVWVPVSPTDTSRGSRNNVPAGSLNSHSLSSSNILVENVASLVVGSDVETDEAFRLRISRFVNSRVSGSRAAVMQAAFSFPGVSDVRVNNFKYGAGSFEILLVPASARLPENVVQRVKAAVKRIVPFGIRVEVRGPEIVPVAMVISVDMREGALSGTKDVALRQVREAVTRYIGNIQMGGELIINRIRALAIEANNSIRDIQIKQLAVDCKPQVISNYSLREDEIFDIDRKLAQPILVV